MKKFHALDEAKDKFDFCFTSDPICPHCASTFSIRKNEAWHLYDEQGPHEVECPACDEKFEVSSHAQWSFSTYEQERDND